MHRTARQLEVLGQGSYTATLDGATGTGCIIETLQRLPDKTTAPLTDGRFRQL
jgi:hypothetical protein